MIAARSFAGKRVALFGLGGSGLASALALLEGGAEVLAFDDNPKALEIAQAKGIRFADLHQIDWRGVAALVLAPGVPLTHPAPHWTVALAREAGVEIIGDIEIFCRERRQLAPQAPLIAITGSNGKSTTTALIAHILSASGRDVQLGGNIGTPILSLAPPANDRFHVIECSSFQIDLAPSLAPSVGVLLNITPDHLDRHGDLSHYASIKERLVAAAEVSVVGVDDDLAAAIAERRQQAGGKLVRISTRRSLPEGIYAEGSWLMEAHEGASRKLASLEGIGSLRGSHNLENAAAAIASAKALGVSAEEILVALPGFPGLPHRMEEVGRRGKVLFINDSKATNADAAAKALASFSRIYWIAGGKPKSGGIGSLAPFFPKMAKAFLIGEAAEEFAQTLAGAVPFVKAGTLAAALTAAAGDAALDPAGESVVLLSPACASYDQFKNFEDRGDSFRSLVQSLDGVWPKGKAD